MLEILKSFLICNAMQTLEHKLDAILYTVVKSVGAKNWLQNSYDETQKPKLKTNQTNGKQKKRKGIHNRKTVQLLVA